MERIYIYILVLGISTAANVIYHFVATTREQNPFRALFVTTSVLIILVVGYILDGYELRIACGRADDFVCQMHDHVRSSDYGYIHWHTLVYLFMAFGIPTIALSFYRWWQRADTNSSTAK